MRMDRIWVPGDDDQKLRDERDWDRQREEDAEERASRANDCYLEGN